MASDGSEGALRVPPIFLGHGGGPCFFMENTGMMEGMGKGSKVAKWLGRVLGDEYGAMLESVKAVLVVSAHWETVNAVGVYRVSGPNSLLYDYSGFPPHTYSIEYPAPGAPDVADRTIELLENAGFETVAETRRGLDHGVFVPLKVALPDATLPVLQVSIDGSYDADRHLRLGEALAPLAEEGVLIIGSGFATHGSSTAAETEAFVDWLTATVTDDTLETQERRAALVNWADQAPYARRAHPREDHLVPLHVVAGVAGCKPGRLIQDHVWKMRGTAMSMASYSWV